MSWFWKSKPASSSGDAFKPEEIAVSPAAPPSDPAPIPVEAPVAPRALTRDEESNQELLAFLKDLQAQADAEEAQRAKPAVSKTPATVQTVLRHDDISPDSLYPTEMSCRSSFDYAMFCQSFGGQFVNIYRYGSFRSCSNHWDDFWLCMRTRNWEKGDREKEVREHYRKKAIKWKTGPSSEDVWEVRQEPVQDPFSGNLADLDAQIAEWKKANPGVPDPWTQKQ